MFRKRHFHLPRFMCSLRFRLLLMFLLIVMLTTFIVAFFAQKSTTNSFNVYVSTKNQKSLDLALSGLRNYNVKAHGNPDLQSEQAMSEQIRLNFNVNVIVVTPTGVVVAASERGLIGDTIIQAHLESPKKADPSDLNNLVIPCSSLSSLTVVISTDGTTFCPNRLKLANEQGIAPEQSFLNSVNGAILRSVCLAGLIALLLALAFSYTIIRPIRYMTRVARRMEAGDLSQRLVMQTHNEIGELAHALNTMADGLQRSERLRRNMINDIAHELRTPLTNIRGYLEALQDQVVDPTSEVITTLYEESSLLTRLVADLQELSLAEAGQLRLYRCPVDLSECIRRATYMLQLQAAAKGVALRIDLPARLSLIEADPERVGQILRNLLNNAITHTPAEGEVTVSAVEHKRMITVSVRDNGCGIEEQHLPSIFERFYRVDPSRSRATGGSGLGLAIAKQMVLAHGGQISVTSQPGHGTCFAFTFPVISPQPLQLEYGLVGTA